MGFAGTLYQAFELLGLSTPPRQLMDGMDPDPKRSTEQAMYLFACAMNRLRNAVATGHGRQSPLSASELDARLAAQIAGLVSDLLLTRMESRGRF